jgi:glycosyltransferase involved in cell wall biosynthesis
MKLLHILPSYAPGGHRSRIALLAAGLGAGFTHRVVALDGGAGAQPLEPGIGLAPFSGAASRTVHFGTMRRLHRLLADERPQALITYNWGAIEAALVNRIARIAPHLHCEDGFSGPAAGQGEPLRRALFRRLILARSIVAVPSQVLAEVAHRRWGIAAERIALIRNGIDTARFAAADAPRLQRLADGLTIGMLSRLSPEKNVGLCLKSFARLPPSPSLRLAIAGDGPERGALEALAIRLSIGDRTQFLGHVQDPVHFLSRVDIFALSSVTEQLPFSLLEAMAAGLPVVATDVGDVRETLAPANRDVLAPSGDEAAFAERLGRLAGSAELRRILGAANAERARNDFDQQKMIKSYRSLLLKLATSRFSSCG